jgi:hypothetical protein
MIKKLQNKIPLDKADDATGGTGVGSAVVEPKITPTPPPEKIDKAPEGTGDKQFDEFGYEKISKDEGDKDPKAKKLDKKPDDKIEKLATGYDKEPPVIVEEVKPPVVEPPVELGFELKVDEVIPKDEVTKVKEFAKAHGLTQTAAQAYLDLRAGEVKEIATAQAEAIKNAEREVAATRSKWYSELKADPVFGGEKMQHNVMHVEKVLQEFMPLTKKELTDRGSVLPPYVMRDLAKLAEHLYSTENLIQGEPSIPEKPAGEKRNPLEYYSN